jgi:predicted glutamine amidotransferase
MRTLRMSVDALDVQSFPTSHARAATGGTVHARSTDPITEPTSTGEIYCIPCPGPSLTCP